MLKAFQPTPLVGLSQCWSVKLETVAIKHIGLVNDLHDRTVSAFQETHNRREQLTALEMFTVIAVSVYELTVIGFLFYPSILALPMAGEGRAAPVAVSDGQLLLWDWVVTIAADHETLQIRTPIWGFSGDALILRVMNSSPLLFR